MVIQRWTKVPDGMGSHTYGWQNHLTVDNPIIDKLNGDEILASEKIQKTSTHVWITFDIVDVTSDDRAIIDNQIYHIKDVDNPMNMNRQLEVMLESTGERYEV